MTFLERIRSSLNLAVLLKDAEFIESVGKGFVSVEGSPEYAATLNDFMMRIQAMTT